MTATGTNPTIVVVPGLRDHVEDHWQTQLVGEFDRVRTVAPLVHYKISLTEHVAALDDVLRSVEGPVHLVAHSAGVMTAVHWAQNATRNISGAFLAAPADLDTPLPEGYPTIDELRRAGWTPVPRRELPFPSIVGASTNDPLATFGAVQARGPQAGSKPRSSGTTTADQPMSTITSVETADSARGRPPTSSRALT